MIKKSTLLMSAAAILVLGIAALPLIPGKGSKQPPVSSNAQVLPLPHDFLLAPFDGFLTLEPPEDQLLKDLDEAIRLQQEEEEILQELIELQKELNRLYELEKLRKQGKLWSA